MVHGLSDRSNVAFDDERVVVNAGLVLAVTLGRRLGLEALFDAAVGLGGRPGASRPGRKVLSLMHAMLLGADCIDDCDVLRAGNTEAILDHRAMAPSTLGTFLRSFTFGHVRQLDRVLGQALGCAWKLGVGPGSGRLVVDVDSFVGEVHGHDKRGAGYGYTGKLGYHPIVATRADTNEVLHVRMRNGRANTQRGALRFVDELIARVRKGGASGPILLRADSGFWNKKVTARLRAQSCEYSIGVSMHKIVSAQIAQIADDAWLRVVDYPDSAICEVAETTLGDDRLIVRRVHLHAQDQQTELFASGAITRSSPIAPKGSTRSMPSTASTPSSSSSSATSRLRRSRTSHPGTTTPTAPGRSSRASRTISADGPTCSASPTAHHAPPPPCAAGCSRSPDA